MAKRKRLTPANPDYLPTQDGGLETKSMFPKYKDGWEGLRSQSAPISAVAGDAAATAALAELSDEMAQARATGRMVLEIAPDQIDAAHLVRDRAHIDADDMQSLMDSLQSRGQQSPIEVVQLDSGRYGLISGARRLEALKRLGSETVLAFLRAPADGADAYVSMVEENEIRANLSIYERARIVVQAAAQGVFGSEKQALKVLFRASPAPRRSKIGSFIPVVKALDGTLQHPQGLTEKNGLVLARALDAHAGLAARLVVALQADTKDAQAEWDVIAQCLTKSEPKKPVSESRSKAQSVVPGLTVHSPKSDQIVLQGPALTAEVREKLLHWLQENVT
ncbi:ParB/RepB/Spo0J family partition protein [Ascidiaceihabitans sp.]|uniref:ParB/RepB/Spo0J family partition protein n=1 Tax=Ascidiaceihabitans sp. TaxID=1872644 RepID=UPI003297702E